MTEPDPATRNWWATLPGVLTALAAIITALAGLFAVLGQQGVLGGKTTPAPVASPAAPSNGPVGLGAQGGPTQVAAAQPAAAPAQSPALVVAGLRAQGFKGLAVTAKDRSVISLAPSAEIYGQAFPLSSGQKVEFDRIASVDIGQPWDGRIRITLVNGQQLDATTGSYTLAGSNELGRYMGSLPDIRRIEFLR